MLSFLPCSQEKAASPSLSIDEIDGEAARVCREAYPDHYSWNQRSKYFDEKSTKEKPRWFMVDVEFVEKFTTPIALDTLKTLRGLENMVVIKRGRLSVQPVSKKEFDIVCRMARKP